MSDRVAVGKVGKPHGLDGAFVVEDASEDPRRFAPGATLFAGGAPATVLESKRAGGRVVLRVDVGVERGDVLEVERESLPPPAPDSYYVFQLVGLDVLEAGGRHLGRIAEVAPGVANDVLELDTGLALPLVAACIREVDLERGRVFVERGFADPE